MKLLIFMFLCLATSVASATQIGKPTLVMNCVNGREVESPQDFVKKVISEWSQDTEFSGIILEKADEARSLSLVFFRGHLRTAIKGRKMGVIEKPEQVQMIYDSAAKQQGCLVFRGKLKDFPILAN